MADDLFLIRQYANTRDPKVLSTVVQRYEDLVYSACVGVSSV